jgi:type II secretory pathway component PulF
VFPLLTLLLMCLLWLIAAGTGVVWNSYRNGKLALSLPLIGPALRLSETARFIRHLGLMLENRVPLGEAVGLLADSTVNGYVQAALHDFQQRLQSGENLGSVISSQPVFPPALAVMLSSAQERGHLSETMLHLGGFYRERAIHALRLVREFFEPFMLVLVGFFIAWIALGFYLPLLNIARITSSGY